MCYDDFFTLFLSKEILNMAANMSSWIITICLLLTFYMVIIICCPPPEKFFFLPACKGRYRPWKCRGQSCRCSALGQVLCDPAPSSWREVSVKQLANKAWEKTCTY